MKKTAPRARVKENRRIRFDAPLLFQLLNNCAVYDTITVSNLLKEVTKIKPGRNDPCPCGSGKKYKKCCLKKPNRTEDFESMLDAFYAKIKSINNQLIEKANLDQLTGYSHGSFTDAMDLAITSNALSLIKGFMSNSFCSVTSDLNVRNIIEHYALLAMDEAGDISADQKELFKEQYKLIEYRFYSEIDFCDDGTTVDPEQMEKNYNSALEVFTSKGYTKKDVKSFSATRAPFLCMKKFDFNEKIRKYLPDCSDAYAYLSTYVHPSWKYPYKEDPEYISIAFRAFMMVKVRYDAYEITDTASLPYTEEERKIYGEIGSYGVNQALFDLMEYQSMMLYDIAKLFEERNEASKYVADFLRDVALVLCDVNTDSHRGYTENAKLKFKVIAEMFACFEWIFSDIANADSRNRLMRGHWLVKRHELCGDECPTEVLDLSFDAYRSIYPGSTLQRDKFEEQFKRSNGFLMDENARIPKLKAFVFDYMDKVFDASLKNPNGASILNLYKILYLESQGMSHGGGYLYFANKGAWMEDINVVVFLDILLKWTLGRISALYSACAAILGEEIDFAHKLAEKVDEMQKAISTKSEVLSTARRIHKDF